MPLPEEANATILLALLARVRRATDLEPWHLGWFKRIYCTYRYLQRLARVDGGRHGAVIATSMPQLVRGLAPALGWQRTEDRFADRDRHHASLRRWLAALEAAGLIHCRAGENEEAELRRTEITLLSAAELEAEELAAAEARWRAWRRRYGPGLETGAERCLGDVFALLRAPEVARRREIGTRRGHAIRAARETASTVLAPPFGALPDTRAIDATPAVTGRDFHDLGDRHGTWRAPARLVATGSPCTRASRVHYAKPGARRSRSLPPTGGRRPWRRRAPCSPRALLLARDRES